MEINTTGVLEKRYMTLPGIGTGTAGAQHDMVEYRYPWMSAAHRNIEQNSNSNEVVNESMVDSTLLFVSESHDTSLKSLRNDFGKGYF
jgi:hypothetical protein